MRTKSTASSKPSQSDRVAKVKQLQRDIHNSQMRIATASAQKGVLDQELSEQQARHEAATDELVALALSGHLGE